MATQKKENGRVIQPTALDGFELATKKTMRRMIISVAGQEKQGKTRFGLTAPGPIALFNLDIGLEGVIDQFVDKKEIQVADFNYRDATKPSEWEEMWERMKKAYYTALSSPRIRSLVVDTASELWELVRLARFGKLDRVQPYHYGPVNAEFRDLIRKSYDSNKNVILLHKMKREYIDDKATGNYERSGFGDTPYLVQANLLTWRITGMDRLTGGKREDGYTGFGITVVDCRQQAELAATELLEPMNSFPFFASQVYPDTEISEWE